MPKAWVNETALDDRTTKAQNAPRPNWQVLRLCVLCAFVVHEKARWSVRKPWTGLKPLLRTVKLRPELALHASRGFWVETQYLASLPWISVLTRQLLQFDKLEQRL